MLNGFVCGLNFMIQSETAVEIRQNAAEPLSDP